MKILLCPDSFKGALSAPHAARALSDGLRRVWPDANLILLPIADGGEGTLDALLAASETIDGAGGQRISQTVCGPLGELMQADWGSLDDGQTAVIELAQAAGLPLVPPDKRDSKTATTFGVGQLLLSALRTPTVRCVVIGLGGSATNDGGAGLLSALGVRFLDAKENELPPGGAALAKLARVDVSRLLFDQDDLARRGVEIRIACDVDNPLLGSRGASAIFGPQKGATPEDIAVLDAALAHFASVWDKPHDTPGMGAAGGCAFGLLSLFPQAQLVPGIDLVLDAAHFNEHLQNADLVLTGEGKLDSQTLGGKAALGVARRVQNQTGGRVPVAALVGALGGDVSADTLARAGIAAVLPLSIGPETLNDALPRTSERLADAAERAARWMGLLGTIKPIMMPTDFSAAESDAIDPARVPTKTLPTGAKMPVIGLGTFGSDKYDAEQIADAVENAARIGYRHFDCASVYGNEAQIGRALQNVQQSGVARSDLWITSKVWNDQHDAVMASCEQSLRDLQLDYLDLFLVHWPFPNSHGKGVDVSSRDPHAQPYVHENYLRTWQQMETLVDRGLVKHIGTSNMTVPKLACLLPDARIKPVANEMELHPHFQQPDLFRFVVENGIIPIGYSPLGSPSRPERDRTEGDTVDMEDPVVLEIARRHSVSPAFVCIQWAISRGQVPIPFSVKPAQFAESLRAAVAPPLSEDEMAALAQIDKNNRLIKGHVFLWKENQPWEDLWDVNGEITAA